MHITIKLPKLKFRLEVISTVNCQFRAKFVINECFISEFKDEGSRFLCDFGYLGDNFIVQSILNEEEQVAIFTDF